MNYTDMLNRIIKDSGLKGVDIVSRCEKSGIKFTQNYLSVLRNTQGKIPSDEVSKAIAEACNKNRPDILVVQAYLDKAPTKIIDFLQAIYDSSMQTTKNLIKVHLSEQHLSEKEYMIQKGELEKAIEKVTLADFICDNMNDTTNMQMEQYADGVIKYLEEAENNSNDIKGYVLIPLDKAKIVSGEQARALGLEN